MSSPRPSGGGSAAPLIRASGVLQGYTTAPQTASAPLIGFNVLDGTFASGQMTITSSVAAPLVLKFALTNPGGSGVWIEISSDGYQVAYNMQSALETHFGANITLNVDGEDNRYFNAPLNTTGSTARLQVTQATYAGVETINAGGYGTDSVQGVGQVTEVILIPKVTGKVIKPVYLLAHAPTGTPLGAVIRFAFKNAGGTYFRISDQVQAGIQYLEPSKSGYINEWINGRADCDLVAYTVTGTPTGTASICAAFAEQY